MFLNNPLSTSTWYQEPNLLGRIFFFLLLNGFWCILLFHQRFYHHPKFPRSSTSPPYNQSLQYHQIAIHQLSHMEPSNSISYWRLWFSSLHWWHPPPPIIISLVLHPQILHTQPGSVRIVSSLMLCLVLFPFHYNRLLPASPLPLMHGKP